MVVASPGHCQGSSTMEFGRISVSFSLNIQKTKIMHLVPTPHGK